MLSQAMPGNDLSNLEKWIVLMSLLSNDGKREISNYEQVPSYLKDEFDDIVRKNTYSGEEPPSLLNMYYLTIAKLATEIYVLDNKGKLNVRNIVVKNKPTLIPIFDAHFPGIINKNTK